MLLDIGTEELAHVEMLSTMIARLLEGAPLNQQEAAMADTPMLAAIFGGMDRSTRSSACASSTASGTTPTDRSRCAGRPAGSSPRRRCRY
jgi:Mn-containing catalase